MDIRQAMAMAWNCSANGRADEALEYYRMIDEALPMGRMNPALSLLRHRVGDADGNVLAIPPNENDVLSIRMDAGHAEHDDAYGLELPAINQDVLTAGIRDVIENFDPGIHGDNVRRHDNPEMEHVFVMSTGRCGTVSLFRLFEQTQYMPFHTYWVHTSFKARVEMMCGMLAGGSKSSASFNHDSDLLIRHWCETRAAEWLGCMNQGRPMMALNHLDTIWAPAFAALHPRSKFIWLHRDEKAVFRSIFGKNQWGSPEWGGEVQLQPVLFRTDPFTWRRAGYDLPQAIAWYMAFTRIFALAFWQAIPDTDRMQSFSSDLLFEGDDTEIDRLIKFTGADISHERVKQHFSTPFNHKAHKLAHDEEALDRATGEFMQAYQKVEKTGRL